MRFEQALQAMRAGKEVKLVKSTGSYFMQAHYQKKQTPVDLRIYYKSADGKICRVKDFGVRYLTMLDWEIVEDEPQS